MITRLDLSVPAQLSLALVPDLFLMGGAMVLLVWAAWNKESDEHQRRIGMASIVVAGIALALVVYFAASLQYTATPGPIAIDNFRWGMDVVILVGTIFAIALSMDDNMRSRITVPESHVLILLASSGMMLLAAARDLMIVFLGIELMSISVYALAGINRRSERSAEGALKYFLLGAFSTAFLLYGIALVYGATGTTNLTMIAGRVQVFHLSRSPLLVAGVAMLLIGFGFKVATVPFHMWAPDVYEGAPSAITAYMAATVKAAAFAAFIRVWLEAFFFNGLQWHTALNGLAIATMIVGNAVGLMQKNLKRLLAYSSIGQAGYLLVAVSAGTLHASSAMLFYLFVYTLTTFGAFAVVVTLTREGQGSVLIEDLNGLWSVRPWLALAMGVLMLSLLGFPVFGGAGFLAKWYVLQAALEAPQAQTTLAVVLVITTVISAGYYLRVVMFMFMRARDAAAPVPERSGGLTNVVLVLSVVTIVVLGVAPNWSINIVNRSQPTIEDPPVTTGLPSPTASLTPPDSTRVAQTRAAEGNR